MKTENQSFTYSKTAKTDICLEIPSVSNQFITEKRYLAGYDIESLTSKSSYIDTLYLLFKQELPTPQQTQLLNALFVALINAGPRDEANRASMLAGVSKTRPEHILPIGLNVLGGTNNGAQSVAKAYQFIQKSVSIFNSNENTLEIEISKLSTLVANNTDNITELTQEYCPGFGQHYGNIDELTFRLSQGIFNIIPESKVFIWCQKFNSQLKSLALGITPIGLSAAVFLHLELGERESIGLYQLLRAPGILAHGMEQSHKPITAIPMLQDDDYHFNQAVNSNE